MIEFIEKDGKLFRRVEPYPLELDTPKPCIVQQIQDDTPMGRYNKSLGNPPYDNVICGKISSVANSIVSTAGKAYCHYSRCNVIAEHCPEGGVYWALWQMMSGKTVSTRSTRLYHIRNAKKERSENVPECGWKIFNPEPIHEHKPEEEQEYSISKRLEKVLRSGKEFLIVTDTEPYYHDVYNTIRIHEKNKGTWTKEDEEAFEEAQQIHAKSNKPELIKGHWYLDTKTGKYLKYINGHYYYDFLATVRYAGDGCRYAFHKNNIKNLVHHGDTLEPDFTKAKVGDEVWNCLRGKEKINTIGGSGDYPISIEWNSMPLDFYTITGRHNINHKHPTLFHSFEHFLAYHKEAEYQRKRGNKELSVEDREGEQE